MLHCLHVHALHHAVLVLIWYVLVVVCVNSCMVLLHLALGPTCTACMMVTSGGDLLVPIA